MPARSAKDINGTLIRSFDGVYYFRIYHGPEQFEDYELTHTDLSVTITDDDAFLYADQLGQRLDHSPQTLSATEPTASDTLRNRGTYFGNNP